MTSVIEKSPGTSRFAWRRPRWRPGSAAAVIVTAGADGLHANWASAGNLRNDLGNLLVRNAAGVHQPKGEWWVYRPARHPRRGLGRPVVGQAQKPMPGQRRRGVVLRHHQDELLDRQRWPIRTEAHKAIFGYIEGWYSTHRLHSSLGYVSPVAYEATDGPGSPTTLIDPVCQNGSIPVGEQSSIR